jgi:hypothetical protein
VHKTLAEEQARGRATMGIEQTVTPTPGCIAAQLVRDRRRRDSAGAICRMFKPAWRRSAISIRSACDRNLGLHCQPLQRRYEPDNLTVAVALTTRPVVPVVREMPTSRAAARMLHPRSRSSTNRATEVIRFGELYQEMREVRQHLFVFTEKCGQMR